MTTVEEKAAQEKLAAERAALAEKMGRPTPIVEHQTKGVTFGILRRPAKPEDKSKFPDVLMYFVANREVSAADFDRCLALAQAKRGQ